MSKTGVRVQRDPTNNPNNAVHSFRISATGPQAKTRILAAKADIVGSGKVCAEVWHAEGQELYCLFAVEVPGGAPGKKIFGAPGIPVVTGQRSLPVRRSVMTPAEREWLAQLYAEGGITACYEAFPDRSPGSISGVLNRLGVKLSKSHCQRRNRS